VREPISPELVLVDPVLAAAARAALPEVPDCLALPPGLAARPRPPAVRVVAPVPTAAPLPLRPRPIRRALARARLVAVPFAASLALLGAWRMVDPESVPGAARQHPAVELQGLAAPPAARPAAPVVLAWPAEAEAAYYNVILVRGERRVDPGPSSRA
jgi:hypothetical protein